MRTPLSNNTTAVGSRMRRDSAGMPTIIVIAMANFASFGRAKALARINSRGSIDFLSRRPDSGRCQAKQPRITCRSQ